MWKSLARLPILYMCMCTSHTLTSLLSKLNINMHDTSIPQHHGRGGGGGGIGGGREEEQSKDPPFPWPQVINNYMHMAGFAYKIDDSTIYMYAEQ